MEALLGNLEDNDKKFYRSVYGALRRAKFGEALIDFDAERLFEICRLAGINVSSSSRAFDEVEKIDKLPAVDSNVKIEDFLYSSKEAIAVLLQYCKALSKEECSTAHFAVSLGTDLDANFLNFIQRIGNPYPKPYRTHGDFGKF